MGSIYIEPDWLKSMYMELLWESYDAQVLGPWTLETNTRFEVLSISNWFHCVDLGALGQTVRILEMFVACAVRRGIIVNDTDAVGRVWDDIQPRFKLYMSCCFLLASKTLDMVEILTPTRIQEYLRTEGVEVSIEQIMLTEQDIFRTIGFRLPIFNTIKMVTLLCSEVGLPAEALTPLCLCVHLVELNRQYIENDVRAVANQYQLLYGQPRVLSLHLAGACIAVVVSADTLPADYGAMVLRLADMVQVCTLYMRILVNVIAEWILPSDPAWEGRRHPNNQQLFNQEEPQPGSSRDPY